MKLSLLRRSSEQDRHRFPRTRGGKLAEPGIFSSLPAVLVTMRRAAKLAAPEAAMAAGLHVDQVYAYERGSTRPELSTLERLLKAYGCSLADLARQLAVANAEALPDDGDLRTEETRVELSLPEAGAFMRGLIGKRTGFVLRFDPVRQIMAICYRETAA